MKQKLLFLMAFMLLGVTVATAQTIKPIAELVSTYGSSATITPELTTPNAAITFDFASSNTGIITVTAAPDKLSCTLSFKGVGTTKVLITPKNGSTSVGTPLEVTVTSNRKNVSIVVGTDPVDPKTYDKTSTATLRPAAFTVSSIVSGDALTIKLGTATFSSPNVGTDIPVNITTAFELQGTNSDYYLLQNAIISGLKGDITRANQASNLGMTTTNIGKKTNDAAFTVETTIEEATLTFVSKSNNCVDVTISNNKPVITPRTAGTVTINFQTAQTTNYNVGTGLITVVVTDPVLENNVITNVTTPDNIIYGKTDYKLNPSVLGSAAISYSIKAGSRTDVLTVASNGTISTLGVGTTIVEIKTAATSVYKETTKDVTLTVTPRSLVLIGGVSVVQKTFDGNSNATISWGNPIFKTDTNNNPVAGDDVSLNTGNFSGAYTQASASDADISVTLSATNPNLNGTKKGNYTLDLTTINSTLKGKINRAPQTAYLGFSTANPPAIEVFAGSTFNIRTVYSTELAVNVKGNPTFAYTLVAGANVTVDATTGVVTFAANATGTAQVKITAPQTTNYLAGEQTLTFSIKATDAVTFTGQDVNGVTLEYGSFDGSNQYVIQANAYSSSGTPLFPTFTAPANESFTITTGGNITILKPGATVSVTATTTSPAATKVIPVTIIKRKVQATSFQVTTKTYDNSVTATVTNWASTLDRKLAADDVSLVQWPTVTFKDKTVNTNKEMVVTGSLQGNKAPYYELLTTTPVKGIINLGIQPSNLGAPVNKTLKYKENYTIPLTINESNTVDISYEVTEGATVVSVNSNGVISYKDVVGNAKVVIKTKAKTGVTCNYTDATAIVNLAVEQADQVISIDNSYNKLFSEGQFTLAPTAQGTPTFLFEPADSPSAQIVDVTQTTGLVRFKTTGTALVKITASETNTYKPASKIVTITITEGVIITTQPQAQTVCANSPFTLNVVASGATSYQWYKDNVVISGATSATYSVTSAVQATHQGSYKVVVSGANGTSVPSNSVMVTVENGVSITTQPLAKTVCQGGSVIFTVVATGNNKTYQWFKNDVVISRETGSSYEISNVQASDTTGGLYKVVVSGSSTCGTNSITSSVVRLGMVSTLPSPLAFNSVPEYLVKRTQDFVIVVGNTAGGYANVSNYAWEYSNSSASLSNNNTGTSNTNTLRVTPNTSDGVLTVTLTHPCANGTNNVLRKTLKAVPAGIDDVIAAGMRVYPNPVSSGTPMTIDLGDGNTGATIYVYNVTGSLLMNANLTSQVSTVPTTLKPGIYMMKIVVPNGKTAHHKFIVK